MIELRNCPRTVRISDEEHVNTTQHITVCVVLCVVFEGVQER